MDTHKIVMRISERHRRFEIRQFLAERQGQTRELLTSPCERSSSDSPAISDITISSVTSLQTQGPRGLGLRHIRALPCAPLPATPGIRH